MKNHLPLLLAVAAVGAAAMSACSDRGEVTGTPEGVKPTATAAEAAIDLSMPLVLDTSAGTVVAAAVNRRPGSAGQVGDLVVDLVTPEREGGARRLILHDASTAEVPALEVWLEDFSGQRVWEMGWVAARTETKIHENVGDCRLDISIQPFGSGQRETYHFTNDNDVQTVSAAVGVSGLSAATLERFRHEYARLGTLRANMDGALTAELLTNKEFQSWLSEHAPSASLSDEGPLPINERFEQLCLALQQCARSKCATQPENPLCLICTGGDILCGILGIFF